MKIDPDYVAAFERDERERNEHAAWWSNAYYSSTAYEGDNENG